MNGSGGYICVWDHTTIVCQHLGIGPTTTISQNGDFFHLTIDVWVPANILRWWLYCVWVPALHHNKPVKIIC